MNDRLKKYQKNINKGQKVICQYFNSADNRFYGEFFTVEIIEVGTDNYKPPRDFVGKLEDGNLGTFWKKEIKGVVS